ncbi:MAG: hypothetical protein PVG03_08500, partial [Desulfarculaceae bacterium]
MKKIRMRRCKQHFESHKITDIPETISAELDKIGFSSLVSPGMRIGVTVGSRGIANLTLITKT